VGGLRRKSGLIIDDVANETIMQARRNRSATEGGYCNAPRRYALEAQMMMINRRDWTPQEDAILQQGALMGHTVGEVARKIDRTMAAVMKRAHSLQIKLRRSRSTCLGLVQTA